MRNPPSGGRHARQAILAVAVAAFAVLLQFDRANAQDLPDYELPEAQMRQAFPEGDAFGALEGAPPAVAVHKDGQLAGYVFSSRQTVQSTGYSAKPLDLVVGMDLAGIITGVAIAEHNEPILIIGVTDRDLDTFIAQYVGVDIRDPVRLTRSHREDGLHGVSGATISSLVMNDAILRSARAVATSRGILGDGGSGLRFDDFAPAGWPELVDEGSLVRLTITSGEARRAIEALGGRLVPEGVPLPADDESFLDLYVGLATPARVGRNLLGERAYARLMSEAQVGDQLLFVAGQGLYSFKGYNYRRSGIFDRLQLIQGNRSYRFARESYQSFETIEPTDAPALREIAVFAIAGETGFDPARPWRLQVLVQGEESAGMTPTALFELSYDLPRRYLAPPEELAEADAPLWLQNWLGRIDEIAVLTAGLAFLTLILVFQDALARRRRLYLVLRIGFLTYTLLWIGWIAGAQLSVVNVLTFADALITNFSWEFFLLEPLIFILWSYVAVALMFWGRGVFCGWLCPFGALQELIHRLAQRLRVPEWRLPFGLHERLWPVKYITFIALFALFLYDPIAAVKGAEVEPFKTAIVLKFDRAWPFGLYAGVLLVAGLFVNRFYCRYLCPLGGALALPARLRMFEWLKRRWQCGTPCQICAHRCPVQAIHPEGKINPNECIHCLNCQTNYFDATLCPPLLERRKRRERARRSKPSIRDAEREGTGTET
jgi:transcriptional regulator of nitric oxide reductase/ferredoxin